jgi:hypothetical protein
VGIRVFRGHEDLFQGNLCLLPDCGKTVEQGAFFVLGFIRGFQRQRGYVSGISLDCQNRGSMA